ncbi:MAG TPA: hypothetical protein VK465_00245 [Fibrobacteria bacterium]|nr:hypothetical protein [Fibrobacteria bacterium]
MKPMMMALLLLACGSFAQAFKELTRKEVREFARAAEAVTEAMQDSRFTQIRDFGPGILKRYASVQIQSDGYAKDQRGAYARADSIVAYAVLRLLCDSLRAGLEFSPPFDRAYANLLAADKILRTLIGSPLLQAFHPVYADTMAHFAETYLEKKIPPFLTAATRLGRPDQAQSLLNALSYKPEFTARARKDIDASIRDAFYTAMASNSVARLEAFAQLYPDYEKKAVEDRLSRIRGDEVGYLLKRGSREELVAFLSANPTSEHVPEVRRRLKPLLYRFAFQAQDLGACQQYLTLFPEPGADKQNMENLVHYLLAVARAAQDSLQAVPTP